MGDFISPYLPCSMPYPLLLHSWLVFGLIILGSNYSNLSVFSLQQNMDKGIIIQVMTYKKQRVGRKL